MGAEEVDRFLQNLASRRLSMAGDGPRMGVDWPHTARPRLTVGGSMSGDNITAGSLGGLTIGGALMEYTVIQIAGNLGPVTIGGSNNGQIQADITSVTIGGNLF
jgi:hypothetical protein